MSSTRKSIINVIPLQVKPDDKRIYTLEKKVFNVTPSLLKPGSPRDFANFLLSKGNVSTYLWENEQQKVVGYLALSVLEDTQKLEIRSIAVAPDFQSSGIGTKMMLYAETIARQKNIHTLLLATSPNNSIALSFYKKLGYTISKTVENYYGDGTPRFVLEKKV